MKPSKPILIAGGIALAAGAIWYIKKSEKPAEEFIPTQGPKTYASSQEASGSFGNFGGGGAPSAGATGVTTVPEPEHNAVCKPGDQVVGISAIAGQQGGIKCISRNNEPVTTGALQQNLQENLGVHNITNEKGEKQFIGI